MNEGCIYFIQVGDDGPIKIGFSSSPGKRLASLQGSHYERLHLIGLKDGNRFSEEVLHEKLAQYRLAREWYAAVPEVLAEIEEPVARIHEALDAAVMAREHLGRAIALLRAADQERGREELARVVSLISEGLRDGATA